MDLNFFATQTIQKNEALSGSGSAVLGAKGLSNGIDFWNVILGDLEEGLINDDKKNKIAIGNDQNIGNQNIKKETADLALLQLALLGQDADQTLEQKLAALRIERIANNPENKIEQLTKLIDHLTTGLPELNLNKNASIEELVTRLTKRLETLQASLESFRTGDFGDDGMPFQALIATGLNPAQMTNITNRIEEVETKLGRELTVEDLIAGVGNIIPVPGSKNNDDNQISIPETLLALLKGDETPEEIAQLKEKIEREERQNNGTENFDAVDLDIAQKEQTTSSPVIGITAPITQANQVLNNNVIASQNAQKIAPAGTNINGLTPTTADGDMAIPTPLQNAQANLNARLSNAEFNAMFGGKDNGMANAMASAQKPGNQIAQAVQSMSSLPSLAMQGDIALPGNWASLLPANSVLADLDIQAGTPFNNVMQAVNHVTAMVAHSGQSHPATSMVSATLTKAAQNADTQNITLQLDPPDLGRVEIRLEFGANKKVKAHLVVEKPETYLMLQRDISNLEKALQNAGLETSGDSINFEMASEDYNFNSNREGNAGNGGTGSSSNSEGDLEAMVIESIMTWDVDPETGHVHYSILA